MINAQRPKIIAHRGASEFAPENTIAAFRQAIADQAEGIEFDIQISEDLVPMVFHDDDLKRIAGRDVLVSEVHSNELRQIDAGSWFNETFPEKAREKFASEKISSLREVLDFLKDYKGLIYVELKGIEDQDNERYAKSVSEVIGSSKLLPQIIVKSFNLDLLPLIKQHCPEVRTAALFSPTVMTLLRKEKRLISIAEELKVDGLSLHFSLVTKKLMKKASDRNLKVAIWTVDNQRWLKRGRRLGIDHLITNNPEKFLAKRFEIVRNRPVRF
jgi:glycerophosphoryl diester phosphodiesterase